MTLVHDFDSTLNRKNTQCKKWDTYGDDVIPMWIADTDFRCPEPIVKAIQKRAEHAIFVILVLTRDMKKLFVVGRKGVSAGK